MSLNRVGDLCVSVVLPESGKSLRCAMTTIFYSDVQASDRCIFMAQFEEMRVLIVT
jgi:hypothetical protein